jgi:GNAT superfamily N-acetyltransferase
MTWLQRLAELGQDWVHLVRRCGWRLALPRIGRDLAGLPYRRIRFLVLARPLLEPVAAFQPKTPLQIREFTPADLELVSQINRLSEVKQCARRLARQHRGLVVLIGDQPAGYAWCLDRIDPALERMHLQLEAGDIYFTDAYVAPAYRGLGVHTAMVLARLRLARRLGYGRLITCVREDNQVALSVWRKMLGVQVTANYDFVRIGPLRWGRYRPWDSTFGAAQTLDER